MQDIYVNTITWLARPDRNFYFAVHKSTFGYDESTDNFPAFSDAFELWIVGYSLTDVQNSLSSLSFGGAFNTFPGLSPLTPVSPSSLIQDAPLLVRIPFTVQFSQASTGSFPSSGSTAQLLLSASIVINGAEYGAEAVFELTPGADPFFVKDEVFYLSQDLNVFTVTPGITNSPISIDGAPVTFTTSDPTTQNDTDAQNYIVQLLNNMNSSSLVTIAPNGNPFANFPSQLLTSGDSSVTPTSPNPNPFAPPYINYNFAVARVRLMEPSNSPQPQVKVFFRLFVTQTTDTDYDFNTSYFSTLDAAGFPNTPLPAPDGETQPFFAVSSAADYALNGSNNRSIPVGGAGTSAYFGCYLNVYDPSINLKQYGTHHCIVGQIAYDNAPIVNSNGVTVGPENCDKLAQRNIQVTFSGNPGSSASRTIPQTFDARPSPPLSIAGGQLMDYPDELLIDWGNVPAGSTASIYWPQVQGIDIIRLARRMYGSEEFSLADPNTLQCAIKRGVTHVPIPSGINQQIAGLLTVTLAPGVVKGQEFNILVRRVSSRQASDSVIAAAPQTQARGRGRTQTNWRYVVGTFQVKIPVATEGDLLGAEENTYAIMSWRLSQLSPSSRWFLVLQRYVSLLGERVAGMGGDPSTITPSPNGAGASSPRPTATKIEEFTGKVAGVIYDRFGDFEGFLLITEAGREHRFEAREPELEELVRFAWIDRVVISVVVDRHTLTRPISIVLRRH